LNTSPTNAGSGSYFGSGSGGLGVGNNGANWGTSRIAASLGRTSSGYRGGENSYAVGTRGFGRNGGTGVITTSSVATSGGYEGSHWDFYRSCSVYGDPTWQTASSDLDNSGSFGYGLENPEDFTAIASEDYGTGYSIANRQPKRGIAA